MKTEHPQITLAKDRAKRLILAAKIKAQSIISDAEAYVAREAELALALEQAGQNFKIIPTYPDYEAGDGGTIRNRVTRQTLKPSPQAPTGHLRVKLRQGGKYHTCYVARLVLMAHRGVPQTNTLRATHGDGNLANNQLSNLRWRPVTTPKVRYATHN